MEYVFGPVASRRLGQSLGVDPIPLKTCNWNCVYCQLGRTRPLTNIRRGYNPREVILEEVQRALSVHQPGEIDWITFVGSGEPTLHIGLGWLIRQVKALTSVPVAVITNGALLSLHEVRLDLVAADAVLPTLDAGNPRLYRKINRPWPKLAYEAYIQGLVAFRQMYTGRLWIEVMLVKELNDTDEALQEIAARLREISPDQVHLLLPLRPPAESWVKPADEAGLLRARTILGDLNCVVPSMGTQSALHSPEDLESAVIGIITRHPMSEEELCAALSRFQPAEVRQALGTLQSVGKAKPVVRHARCFWTAAGTFFDV